MNIITVDAETFFDDEYTLKKLTLEAYCRDPRFEPLLWGVKINNEPAWWGREDAVEFLRANASTSIFLGHHVAFDGLILSHHYGVRPAYFLDTLSMARLVHGNTVRAGLDSLASIYGLKPKMAPYALFKGRRWRDLSSDIKNEIADGCLHDCALTWSIFREMLPEVPREELDIIDLTIRLFTEGSLEGDVEELARIKQDEWRKKQDQQAALQVSVDDLQSADRFVKLLEAEGVEVETKPGKNGDIPAIAATDPFIKDILDNEPDDSRVRALVEARLSAKSTIDETRAARLEGMARRGPLCVYLGYCGAQTLRWSGGDKVNFQNFRRGGAIRKALMAPRGHKLIVADSSQIECRTLNVVAGNDWMVEVFRRGEDPYVGTASTFYGREITKADKAERGLGKQLVLSCGYGSGAETIVRTAARGTYGPPLTLTPEQGVRARDIYRGTHKPIVQLWHDADAMLRRMATEGFAPLIWREVVEIRGNRIYGPNGAWMTYELAWDGVEGQWRRRTRQGWVKIWGGVLVQNLMEFLDRIYLAQAALRIRAHGIRVATLTHDEIVAVVPEAEAEAAYGVVMAEMTRPLAWLPRLPLAAEGAITDRYEK